MTGRREAVARGGPVFVASFLPPPCPPWSVLRPPPWEQAESYYDFC
jgi:hypothetical protein